jgi:hypothetical protein
MSITSRDHKYAKNTLFDYPVSESPPQRKFLSFSPAEEFKANQPVKIRFNWMGTLYLQRPNGDTVWMPVVEKKSVDQ